MKLTSNEAKNILENFRGKTESDRWIEHCISVIQYQVGTVNERTKTI